MPQKSTNIYQRARETAGITQERAAEAIGYSVESIKAYENDHRIPPDKAVAAMIDVYGTMHLGHQHLRHASTIGRDLLPDVSEKELAEAVISFFASIPNLQHEVKNSLEVANFQTYKDCGLKEKVWYSPSNASDPRHRRVDHLRLNGERVPIDSIFSNGLRYPGDPLGRAEDVINCKCKILPGR